MSLFIEQVSVGAKTKQDRVTPGQLRKKTSHSSRHIRAGTAVRVGKIHRRLNDDFDHRISVHSSAAVYMAGSLNGIIKLLLSRCMAKMKKKRKELRDNHNAALNLKTGNVELLGFGSSKGAVSQGAASSRSRGRPSTAGSRSTRAGWNTNRTGTSDGKVTGDQTDDGESDGEGGDLKDEFEDLGEQEDDGDEEWEDVDDGDQEDPDDIDFDSSYITDDIVHEVLEEDPNLAFLFKLTKARLDKHLTGSLPDENDSDEEAFEVTPERCRKGLAPFFKQNINITEDGMYRLLSIGETGVWTQAKVDRIVGNAAWIAIHFHKKDIDDMDIIHALRADTAISLLVERQPLSYQAAIHDITMEAEESSHTSLVRPEDISEPGFDVERSIIDMLYYSCRVGRHDIVPALVIMLRTRNSTFSISSFNEYGRCLLHDSCASGNYECTKLLLQMGSANDAQVPSPDEMGETGLSKIDEDEIGMTPLMFAAAKGDYKGIEALCNRNHPNMVRRDKRGNTCLHHAAENGRLECVNLLCRLAEKAKCPNELLNARNNAYESAISLAAEFGYLEMVILLHSKGASWDFEDLSMIISYASEDGHVEMLEHLARSNVNADRQNEDGETSLVLSTRSGQFRAVEYNLSRGANPNQFAPNGQTVLMIAAEHDHFDTVEVLLKGGADPDIAMDGAEDTALMFAAQNGHAHSVIILLGGGAKVKGPALLMASYGGHINVVESLIESRPGLNYFDGLFNTSLMYASKNGHESVVSALINSGADMNRQNRRGLTALHFASQYGHVGVVQKLLSSGADYNLVDSLGLTAEASAKTFGRQKVLYVFENNDFSTIVRASSGEEFVQEWKSTMEQFALARKSLLPSEHLPSQAGVLGKEVALFTDVQNQITLEKCNSSWLFCQELKFEEEFAKIQKEIMELAQKDAGEDLDRAVDHREKFRDEVQENTKKAIGVINNLMEIMKRRQIQRDESVVEFKALPGIENVDPSLAHRQEKDLEGNPEEVRKLVRQFHMWKQEVLRKMGETLRSTNIELKEALDHVKMEIEVISKSEDILIRGRDLSVRMAQLLSVRTKVLQQEPISEELDNYRAIQEYYSKLVEDQEDYTFNLTNVGKVRAAKLDAEKEKRKRLVEKADLVHQMELLTIDSELRGDDSEATQKQLKDLERGLFNLDLAIKQAAKDSENANATLEQYAHEYPELLYDPRDTLPRHIIYSQFMNDRKLTDYSSIQYLEDVSNDRKKYYIARYKTDLCFLKSIHEPYDIALFKNEVNVISALTKGMYSHPSIIKLEAVFLDKAVESSPIVYVHKSHCSGGTLEQRIIKEKDESLDLKNIFMMILEALAFMHDRGIVHRNLRLSKIHLDEGRPVITGFCYGHNLADAQALLAKTPYADKSAYEMARVREEEAREMSAEEEIVPLSPQQDAKQRTPFSRAPSGENTPTGQMSTVASPRETGGGGKKKPMLSVDTSMSPKMGVESLQSGIVTGRSAHQMPGTANSRYQGKHMFVPSTPNMRVMPKGFEALEFSEKKAMKYDDIKINLADIVTHEIVNAHGVTLTETNPCVAPEILLGSEGFETSDMWSFAIMMYQAHFGRFPVEGTFPFITPYHEDENLRNLIESLLKEHPEDRPSARECLSHPYFNKGIPVGTLRASQSTENSGLKAFQRYTYDLRKMARAEGSVLHIEIIRDQPTVSFLSALAEVERETLSRLIRVTYTDQESGEHGSDVFGLIFYDIVKQMQSENPLYKFFESGVPNGPVLPYQREDFSQSSAKMFVGLGRAFMKALLDGRPVSLPLSTALIKYLLGRPFKFTDLESYDPETALGLRKMLASNLSLQDIVGLQEAVQHGTLLTKEEYIDGKVKEILFTRREKALEALKEGFHAVADASTFLDLLSVEEFRLLVCGRQDVDNKSVIKNLRFIDFPNAVTASHLKKFVNSLEVEDLHKFLKLTTGMAKLPQGMKLPRIIIQRNRLSLRHFPVGHYCFNLLELPDYQDSAVLNNKMKRFLIEASSSAAFIDDDREDDD